MVLSAGILQILDQRYDTSTLVERRYKDLDLSFKTDEHGVPILLFIGKRDEKGAIKGKRYVRTLIRDTKGHRIKDHWELKGKAS